MAPKRPAQKEEPPPAVSSSSEEDTSSGEEEASSSGEEEPPKVISPPSSQAPTKKPEESGSETESDSDSEQSGDDVPSSAVKPIASKPMQETPPKKPRSKPAVTATASKSTTAKRAIETGQDGNDPKRAKKKDVEHDGVSEKSEDPKKQLFQRLFSEDDEIVVLKGIIDFTTKKGIDPVKDINAFYEFIKKSLTADFSVSQLKDKVVRLKRRFENNVSKSKVGENKTFSKPQAQQVFDLMKKIWGSEGVSGGGAESSVKSNGKAKKSGTKFQRGNSNNLELLKAELGIDVPQGKHINGANMGVKQKLSSFSITGMEDYVMKMGMDMLDGEKKEEMEKKWKELHEAELELFLRRSELITEQAKLMLAAYKNKKD